MPHFTVPFVEVFPFSLLLRIKMKTIVVYTDEFETDLQGHLTGECEDWSNPEDGVFVIQSCINKIKLWKNKIST